MKPIQALIQIVKKLRDKGGCPWDREQTMKSITPYIIEEAYELVEAIHNNAAPEIREELGDVLLHVVMLSNMAEEQKLFSFDDVANTVKEKMVQRHPHVFSTTTVDSVDQVWKNWEEIKAKQKKKSIMSDIPNSLPGLIQANKIQKKASRMGFDWKEKDFQGPLNKIYEELNEIKEAVHQSDKPDALKEEVGDLFFSMVNLARKLNIDPEEALKKSNQKFLNRFSQMESIAKQKKVDFKHMTLDELDQLWNQVKQLQ